MCSSGSFPQGRLPSMCCSVTSAVACSKWCGDGSTCDSSPSRAEFGHSRWTVRTHSSRSSPQQTFIPPVIGPLPPCSRYCATASLSGLVVTKPSPIRAATSIALGPKPETRMGGVSSGSEYSRAASSV